MATPPKKRKKASIKVSSVRTPSDVQATEENPATAIITVTAVELPELTEAEQSDRLHLERRVERAFFEAGKALAELRNRKLYRSTHDTVEARIVRSQSIKMLQKPTLSVGLAADLFLNEI